MSGALTKLKIQAYSNPEMTDKLGDPFVTTINPEKYSRSYKTEYNVESPQGTSAPVIKFFRSEVQDLDLEFLFDRTGIFDKDTSRNVQQDIDDFTKIIYTLNGEEHRPNYLQVYWGTLIFNCILYEMQIEYKLFRSDGNPIRAIVKAKFKDFISEEKRIAKENKTSPDLTHVRIVNAGDTLPLMCYKIYGDSKYYIEVAKVNKINSFRTLTPGQQIYFPPIEKRS
ncbi:MAG: LysM peptidoglycan-binding domain-containing protein [Flavobacteriia bacterium]|nr:LysM peptidoglycan-binding domain-containing protein [Flavobacteriia bacterium]OJX37513.1 MAG: hypothetical protein BGO87_00700 [Flavobacteriia bacterium 40-80]